MVAILVARARAEDLLGKQIESGRAVGDALAQGVNSEAAYRGWKQDKERWKSLSVEALGHIYGGDSKEAREFDQSGSVYIAVGGTPWHVRAQQALERHGSSLNVLQSLVERLEFAEEPLGLATNPEPEEKSVPTGVFVVHGHNELIREQVARTINEDGGRKAVILHEQANRGQTLIEKFERHASEAGWAVILLTADDVGGTSDDNLHPRARQNVVLEMGFFYGRLGREHVAVLYEEGVQLPSDTDGIAYIPLDRGGAWKARVLREIE
jgi:hypothetical protein